MKVRVEADTQTLIRFWLVPVGIFLAGLAIYSARTALVLIGVAIFLALALNAPVNRLAKLLPKNSRVGGTALAFVIVVALLGTIFTLLVPPIVQQTAKFVETIPAVVDGATEQYNGLNQLIDKYDLRTEVDQALESMKSNATSWATDVPSKIVNSLSSVGGALASLMIILVLSFLMLIEGPAIMKRIWHLYTDDAKREYHKHIVSRMYRVVNGFVVGQLTVAGIGALVMALFVFVLSFIFPIPSNLVIPTAAIYFVLTLIPMFGSTIAAILLGLLLALNSWVAAVVFIVGFIVYQQIENNIISPVIQSRQLELTALWVLLGVTVGIYVFGILGAIIAIPVVGCIKVLFDEYIDRNGGLTTKKSPKSKLARTKS